MSQLTSLKQEVEQLAKSAKSTAGSLGAFKTKFRDSMQGVERSIGGSAQRKDREVIDSLTAAQQAVESAIAALEAAASTASAYGRSL